MENTEFTIEFLNRLLEAGNTKATYKDCSLL